MLMIKKEFYTSPEVDVFTVQTEGVICASGDFDVDGFTNDETPLGFSVMDAFSNGGLL